MVVGMMMSACYRTPTMSQLPCEASDQQCLGLPQHPGSTGPPHFSLSQKRGVRINGVSQLAQGHDARKRRSWGWSCLPGLSYSESQNPRHPPQASLHLLCAAPTAVAFAQKAA